MRVKRVELNDFKRFTHLVVEDIPETAQMVVMVGPNGSGKTSFMEAMNHYYKYYGFSNLGDYYLRKTGNSKGFDNREWHTFAPNMVNIDFYDIEAPRQHGYSDMRGRFYFRSAYRNEPDFTIGSMQKQGNPTDGFRLATLIQNDQTVSANYQRLITNTISRVFDDNNGEKSVSVLRNELTGKLT